MPLRASVRAEAHTQTHIHIHIHIQTYGTYIHTYIHTGALFLTNRRRVTLLLVSRTRTALPSMTTRSLAAERHRDTSKKYYCRGGRSQNLLRKLVWRLKPLRSRTLALQKHFDPTSFSRPSSGPRRGPACTREPSPTSTLDAKSDFSRPLASVRGLEKSDVSLSAGVGEGSHVHAGRSREGCQVEVFDSQVSY